MQLGLSQAQNDAMSGIAQQKITVELTDLDWEDRERILRLLFSKMNTGQSSSDWREKPGANSKAGSSHMATGLNQSFREQEDEEDYDDEGDDAKIFE